ncbi:hypothetical protein BVY03_00230 [bacterium K02(2017)]|nr:hypothetical protein BVY03_00230 [bacterium K02(2017)]
MKTIFMSQMAIAKKPENLRTILGSCIGIVLFDKKTGLYGMSHIMLPEAHEKEPKVPGKYADTALPALINMMQVDLDNAHQLVAKIAGGASMFGDVVVTSNLNIGENNIKKVKELLKELKIEIVNEDLGGEKGRQLIIDTETDKIFVNQIGDNKKEL